MYTEDQLIDGLLTEQADAYRFAVKNYHSAMVKVSRAIVGDVFAEEVVQDSWISVIKGLPNFQRRSSLKTWILQIVSNTAKTRARKEKKYLKFSLERSFGEYGDDKMRYCPDTQWHMDTPDAILNSQALKKHIESSFNMLPVMQQAVLTLVDIEDLSTPEICDMLELSESNVRVLAHRARLKLRKAIEEFQT